MLLANRVIQCKAVSLDPYQNKNTRPGTRTPAPKRDHSVIKCEGIRYLFTRLL